ncbi:hypothetical protein L227DRAFT_563972 [Lentinus tigrinus ALCF2SS1-6]|uniref:Uncharacterized protein n=1 Tax=Lentinus tigrinus ALCF2SS1-6 TaxID=1328759 RepID=A0A5C2S8F8_9APHY|nr:hypothetical protein L227DRAFT_563972 [Lentinus tigrinus ALCF2SS1-6]
MYATPSGGPSDALSEVWMGRGTYDVDMGPVVEDLILMTMTLPTELDLVWGFHSRFSAWTVGLRGLDPLFPALRPGQREPLLDLAQFYRVMAMRGQVQVPLRVWPEFVSTLTEALPFGRVQRGEDHLQRVSEWLRGRFPDSGWTLSSLYPLWPVAPQHIFEAVPRARSG